MADQFEQFFQSIVTQESGGSYSARGSQTRYGRAYGKYQVLDSNIPGWTAKYYGRSLTPEQFLKNHAAQDAVARGVLKSYYNKWGARGAAAAWYGGPGSHNLDQSTAPQQGGPSIKGYVDSVVSRMGGGGGGGSTANTSTGGTSTTMGRAESAESYGFVESLFDAVPELKRKFDQAVKGQWSAQKFQASIRDTTWWKSHSQQERDYLTKTYGDPATAKQEFSQAYTHIQQMAGQLGIQPGDQNKKFLNAMAYNVAAKGWNDDQLRFEMGKHLYFQGDNRLGQVGDEVDKLQNYAYSMGVTMAGTWYANSSRDITRGIATEQTFQSQIRKQAKAMFPNWSKQIDAGQSVADLANPYLTSMSQILELPGGSINLFDPTVKKALQFKDPNTGQNTVKPLWQFENELRADPRWRKTQNAQNSLMQVAHQVLSDFGLKY